MIILQYTTTKSLVEAKQSALYGKHSVYSIVDYIRFPRKVVQILLGIMCEQQIVNSRLTMTSEISENTGTRKRLLVAEHL